MKKIFIGIIIIILIAVLVWLSAPFVFSKISPFFEKKEQGGGNAGLDRNTEKEANDLNSADEEIILGDKKYGWISEKGNIDFNNISWHKIASSRLGGFSPEYDVVELTDMDCGGEGHYLREEGGMLRVGYCLKAKKQTDTIIIDSLAKLKEVYAPVENEAEAISFAAVLTGDYQSQEEILVGYSASVDDYYLVRIVHKNTYGCGSHEPTEVIYKVAKNGDGEAVIREIPLQGDSNAMMCVD